MILIDINQILISNIFINLKRNGNYNENLVRHMVLNSLRLHKKQFRDTYGEMILCCDSFSYWRKKEFPFYKSERKKAREKSALNWFEIHRLFDVLKQEMRDNLPYKMINILGGEADDVIAVLAKNFHEREKILIISADKDFLQLQKYDNIDQYDPIRKKWLSIDDPEFFLMEQIICGQKKDSIPNIFSPDDQFVKEEPIKAPMVTKKRMNDMIDKIKTRSLGEYEKNYYRNSLLIDFENIPYNISAAIIDEYKESETATREKMKDYFSQHNLQKLTENINDF